MAYLFKLLLLTLIGGGCNDKNFSLSLNFSFKKTHSRGTCFAYISYSYTLCPQNNLNLQENNYNVSNNEIEMTSK